MRRLELLTPLSSDPQTAWAALIRTGDWPMWGRLVVSAEGAFEPGATWRMTLIGTDGRPPRTMTPRLVSMIPGRQVVFETRLGPGWVVRMVHTFDIEPAGAGHSQLRQTFAITGLLVWPLWRWLHPGMMQFSQLGADLAEHLRR